MPNPKIGIYIAFIGAIINMFWAFILVLNKSYTATILSIMSAACCIAFLKKFGSERKGQIGCFLGAILMIPAAIFPLLTNPQFMIFITFFSGGILMIIGGILMIVSK